MPTAQRKSVKLQKLEEDFKQAVERFENARKILRTDKSLVQKLQDSTVSNLYQKLMQRVVNELTVFGASTRWNTLTDGMQAQLNNQHEKLLKNLDIQLLTSEKEKHFGLNDPQAGKLIYERPRSAVNSRANLDASLLRDHCPFNMSNIPGGIERIRMFTWQNYLGVALYTDWGNYFGPPTNILEYAEYLKDMALKASIENENLHEKLALEEESEHLFKVEHTYQLKDESEKLRQEVTGIEEEKNDFDGDESTPETPKFKLVKTKPF